MIRKSAIGVAASALLLSACQSMQGGGMFGGGMSIDGQWASGDGISVTTFQGGALSTRFVGTNELIGQGTYAVSGNTATMNWISLSSRQNRSATCVIASPSQMTCTPPGGQSFVLNRTA
jgi:hypothetical protein